MVIFLSVLIIAVTVFWLVFSDSIMEEVNGYFQRKSKVRERKRNPPSCKDCKWIKFFPVAPEDESLATCKHPMGRYKYVQIERGEGSGCGPYGDNFEEK